MVRSLNNDAREFFIIFFYCSCEYVLQFFFTSLFLGDTKLILSNKGYTSTCRRLDTSNTFVVQSDIHHPLPSSSSFCAAVIGEWTSSSVFKRSKTLFYTSFFYLCQDLLVLQSRSFITAKTENKLMQFSESWQMLGKAMEALPGSCHAKMWGQPVM